MAGQIPNAKKRKLNLVIPALIAAAVTPGAAALIFYKVTGDPTMQPLGITLSKLAGRYTTGQTSGILVQVEWGRNANTPNTPEEVVAALEKSMGVYGIDFLVRVQDSKGDTIRIFFETGSSRIGPYNLADVASGIGPALAAFKMSSQVYK